MFNPGAKPSQTSQWRLLLAFLCLILVVACGTIQAVHVHPDGDISHADCSLCVTAHLAAQVAVPTVMLFVAPIIAAVETYRPCTRAGTFSTFALFTRPPPADPVLR
ncbi:hypothetical protein [Granulicella sp. L60]|uniref:hypothetical protein n=1 Tax=Granulicella sp. L60 TaxID=1641866 RepID=UPI00131BC977|nr:hypothetical protein [Granulicella sp. L60]